MNNPFRNSSSAGGSFLPMDYVARKSEARANILVLSMFALVMAGVIGAFFLLVRSTRSLNDRESVVAAASAAEAAKLEQVRSLMSQRAQLMEKAEITAALVEKIPRWAMLGDIVLRMPKDMRLEQMSLKGKRMEPPPPPQPPGGKPAPQVKTLTGAQAAKPADSQPKKVSPPKFEYTLTLTGAADKNNDVADFLTALKASPILQSVELQYIKESKEKEQVFRKFEINAVLTRTPDTEAIAASLRELMQNNKTAKGGGAPAAAPAAEAPLSSAMKAIRDTLKRGPKSADAANPKEGD